MSHFARQRFEQGVIRVPQFGTVSRLTLAPMTRDKLLDVIAARVRPLLAEFFGRDTYDLPPLFPYTEDDLKAALSTQAGLPLRLALQSLRDSYDRRIFGKTIAAAATAPAAIAPAPGAALEADMEKHWQQQLREARRRGVVPDELQAGMQDWLQSMIATATPTSAGRLLTVRNENFGKHPAYGQITTFQLQRAEGIANLAVGILLGAGKGMSVDLETKLSIVAGRNGTLDRLVLLWPKGSDVPSPIDEQLPKATRDVWLTYAKKGVTQRVQLKAIDEETMHPWLALPRCAAKSKLKSKERPTKPCTASSSSTPATCYHWSAVH